jgi:hypothetical protein
MPRQLTPQAQEAITFPLTVEEMMDLLKQTFPEPRINPDLTPEQVMYAAGQRSVVLFLLAREQRAQSKE